MSINKAQAKAIADGFLDTLGSAPPSNDLPILEAVLEQAARSFIQSATDKLDKAKAIDTGELSTELTFAVTTLGKDYILTVGYSSTSRAAKYFDYVNKGVSGTEKNQGSPYSFKNNKVSRAFVDAIAAWQKRQGIGASNIRKPVSGLERKRIGIRSTVKAASSLRSLAYATAVSIKKKGRKPTHYFDDAVKESFGPELIEALSVALAGDVRLQIRQINN